MPDANEIDIDVDGTGVPAARLANMTLGTTQRKTPATLPSDDRLLISVPDRVLKANNIEVETLVPGVDDDPKSNVHTYFTGEEFQKLPGLGSKTALELDKEALFIKYNDNYYTKSQLFNHIEGDYTFKEKEFRRITKSLGLTAVRDNELYEFGQRNKKDQNGKVMFDKDKKAIKVTNYRLDGEAQIYQTPAGPRRREVAYKNFYANGEQVSDVMFQRPDGCTKGFSRLPNDRFSEHPTVWDVQNELGGEVRLKSKLHNFETLEYIERTQGQNQATARFKDYVGEARGYNQDIDSAYVKIGSQYFPVREVVESMPDDPATKAVQGKPNEAQLEHRILIRSPEGNSFASPSFIADKHPNYFKNVCDEHSINPAWGKFKPKFGVLLDSYSHHEKVLVEIDGVLAEASAVELDHGKNILEMHKTEKIFTGSEDKPSFTCLASTLQRTTQEKNAGKSPDIPDSVFAVLTDRRLPNQVDEGIDMASPQPPPGVQYEPRNDRVRGAFGL